jgi:hypothetical protein
MLGASIDAGSRLEAHHETKVACYIIQLRLLSRWIPSPPSSLCPPHHPPADANLAYHTCFYPDSAQDMEVGDAFRRLQGPGVLGHVD